MKPSRYAFSALALAVGAALAQTPATTPGTEAATPPVTQPAATPPSGEVRDPIDIRRWDASALRGGYSGERLIGATARGEDGETFGEVANFLVNREGRITGVIIESQGVLEVGDTHVFVPWKQVELGPDVSWVQVPVNERNLPDFSLFNDDESIYKPGAVYRGDELMGEFVRLEAGAPYGYIDDVVFSADGRIQAIVVSPDAAYGYGVYAYPYYHGLYNPALGYYDMPYDGDDLAALKPFDYSSLGIAAEEQVAQAEPAER